MDHAAVSGIGAPRGFENRGTHMREAASARSLGKLRGRTMGGMLEWLGCEIVRRPCEMPTMTIEAIVENGQIVLPAPLDVPNGTRVQVSVQGKSTADLESDKVAGRTINERLRNVIGKARDLPADLAENHDYYLHGGAKRTEP